MIGNRPWTPEDDQRLRKLAASATSVAEIAKRTALGRQKKTPDFARFCASRILIVAKLKRTMASIKSRATVIGLSFNQIKLGLKAKGK